MTINETVGSWLSVMRATHSLTTEQIADAAQKYGCNWHGSTISSMERGGSRADALGNILILLSALNDLTGEELTLADALGDDFTAGGKALTGMTAALQGEPVHLTPYIYIEPSKGRQPTSAENRMATRLGVKPPVLVRNVDRLYGHSVDAEAAERAGEGATPQKRGRETRIIEGEVADAIANEPSIMEQLQEMLKDADGR
ncbi:MAG: hypothetical protein UHD09_09075 [Bifidobacterium sp.]|nr:hypothetical protein [Bifidobacterium sp.]